MSKSIRELHGDSCLQFYGMHGWLHCTACVKEARDEATPSQQERLAALRKIRDSLRQYGGEVEALAEQLPVNHEDTTLQWQVIRKLENLRADYRDEFGDLIHGITVLCWHAQYEDQRRRGEPIAGIDYL